MGTKFLFRNFHIRNSQKKGDHNKPIFPKNVCYYPKEKQNKTRNYGRPCNMNQQDALFSIKLFQ